MFKSILALLAGALLTVSCVAEDSVEVVHHTMEAPPEAQLASIQCDQPCAVFYDADKRSYVMQYFNGSTYTIILPK